MVLIYLDIRYVVYHDIRWPFSRSAARNLSPKIIKARSICAHLCTSEAMMGVWSSLLKAAVANHRCAL